MQRLHRKRWLIATASVGLAALIALVTRCLFTPTYQTNDDVGMSFWANGVVFCDAPTPFLLYSNYLYGQLLVWLHRLAPATNWHRILAEAIHLLATGALCYAVLRTEFRLRTAALLGVYLLAFDLLFWRSPQFTVTAFLAALSGVLLVLRASTAGERPSAAATVAGIMLVLTGGLLRNDSACLALAMSGPLFAGSLAFRPRSAARRVAGFLLIAGAGLYGAGLYHRACYDRAPGWKGFAEFNRLRAEFNDYGRVEYNEQTRPVFDRVGWSKNDLAMFCAWFYSDEERFCTDKVRQIVQSIPPPEPAAMSRRVVDGLRPLLAAPESRLMLVAIGVTLAAVRWDRRRALGLILLLLLFCGLTVYLLTWMKLPTRVFWPMLGFLQIATLLAAVACFPVGNSSRWRVWLEAAGLLVFAAFLWGECRRARQESHEFRAINAQWHAAVAELAPRPDELYVPWGSAFPYELIHPDESLDYLRNLKLLSIGAAMRTPTINQRMAQFEIGDLYRALYERPNVWLLASRERLALFREYVREHYGTDVAVERERVIPIGRFRGQMLALKMCKLTAAKPWAPPAAAGR